MSVNRFILENLVSRAIGTVVPPYWYRQRNAAVEIADEYEGEAGAEVVRAGAFRNEMAEMSDEELKVLIRNNALGFPMAVPLDIEVPGEKKMWTFPWEPIITLKGKNAIVRRRAAKSEKRGTIKEYWTQDDYEINIQGMLMDCFNEQRYPKEDVDKLRRICEAGKSLRVNCSLLELFDISQLVIEDFELPFTKGENAQGYTLKAYSDDLFELLIDETALNLK